MQGIGICMNNGNIIENQIFGTMNGGIMRIDGLSLPLIYKYNMLQWSQKQYEITIFINNSDFTYNCYYCQNNSLQIYDLQNIQYDLSICTGKNMISFYQSFQLCVFFFFFFCFPVQHMGDY